MVIETQIARNDATPNPAQRDDATPSKPQQERDATPTPSTNTNLGLGEVVWFDCDTVVFVSPLMESTRMIGGKYRHAQIRGKRPDIWYDCHEPEGQVWLPCESFIECDDSDGEDGEEIPSELGQVRPALQDKKPGEEEPSSAPSQRNGGPKKKTAIFHLFLILASHLLSVGAKTGYKKQFLDWMEPDEFLGAEDTQSIIGSGGHADMGGGSPLISFSSGEIEGNHPPARDFYPAHKREYVGVARASTPEKGPLPFEKGNASRSSLVQSSGNTTAPNSFVLISSTSGASFAHGKDGKGMEVGGILP